jgi:hypothetical protein
MSLIKSLMLALGQSAIPHREHVRVAAEFATESPQMRRVLINMAGAAPA